jgi:O-acetyl-ADP-ribose deacetylase (regulator of RNase III)
MTLAKQNDLSSIAFPAISCGVYGYPIDQAVEIAVDTVRESLATNTAMEHVYFVCFGAEVCNAYQRKLGVAPTTA